MFVFEGTKDTDGSTELFDGAQAPTHPPKNKEKISQITMMSGQ